ncbi:uncharacterized protein [Fopius arisanus]|uniref:HTH CENPB-type domain-containing protein n=1 Tax=Fopius arisanus TaxID=64838 RepID=A0A9R1TNN3_9HYME|nr:PREDICTED: uncharacterized protein LOC105272253 [Fopius arisanus]XP_011312592.1 PREDICTED: uncharacterized protein LOC105272253 [Fopius arisanus]
MSGRKRPQSRIKNAMKEELLKWLCIQHATHAPLNRNILRLKANELVGRFDLTSFKCAESWLTTFLKRYHFPANLAEGVGPIFDDYHTWVEMIHGLINQYSYDDQYHLDELTMYTDFSPSTVYQPEITPDAPVDMSTLKLDVTTPSMYQTTILLVCNATGTQKQKPLISSPYPVQNNESYDYIQNDSSRITDEILSAYLFMVNHQMAEKGRVILLFMSRTRINILKMVRFTHILPVFLPYHFPSHLKPLRRDVSHCIKMSYRKSYITRLLSTEDGLWTPQDISQALVDSWLQLPREIIIVRFQRTKFRTDESSLSFECPEWESLETGVPFERFVTFDDDLGDGPGPMREDLRFLSRVKMQFNLKNSKATTGAGPQPQAGTSREEHLQRTGENHPGVGNIQDGRANPVKTSILMNIKSEEIHSGGAEDKTPAEVPLPNSSPDTPLNETSDTATPVTKLFPEDGDSSLIEASESTKSEDTESLMSRVHSMVDDFDSSLDNSLVPDDPGRMRVTAVKDLVDSGVPDSSVEPLDSPDDKRNETVEISSSMEVEVGDNPLDTSPGEPSSPHDTPELSTNASFPTSSIRGDQNEGNGNNEENSSASILTVLVDDVQGTSPGAVTSGFIDNPSTGYSDLQEVLDTSTEEKIITAARFVDEKMNYYASTVDRNGDNVENCDGFEREDLVGKNEGLVNTSRADKVDIPGINTPRIAEELTDCEKPLIVNLKNSPEDIPDPMEYSAAFEDIPPLPQVVGKPGTLSNNSTKFSSVVNTQGEIPLDASGIFKPIIINLSTSEVYPGVQMRALTTTPVIQDNYDTEKIYSTETALQEASRELEEKLRDLEASDSSRKISNFLDDDDNSGSSRSNEATSLLRDILNEAKELSETEFKGFSEKYLLEEGRCTNYCRGIKRPQEGDDELPDKKKLMSQENWAKCFENFPVFGPYNSESEPKDFRTDVNQREESCVFTCSEETLNPGPSSSE